MSFSFNPITGNLDKVNPPVDISGKQDTLVSGTSIKTVNSTSLLGSGDIVVAAGSDPLKEDVANKSTTTTLGTSDTLYPSQKAVKTYVDTTTGAYVPLAGGTMTGDLNLLDGNLKIGNYSVNTGDGLIELTGGTGGATNKGLQIKNGATAAFRLLPSTDSIFLQNTGSGDILLTGLNNATLGGSIVLKTDTAVRPDSNRVTSLGLATKYWGNLYASRHYLNSTAYLDGGTAGVIGVTGDLTVVGNTQTRRLILSTSFVTDGIYGDVTSGLVRLSGGTLNNGAVIILGGSTHSSVANIGILRVGATSVVSWNVAGLFPTFNLGASLGSSSNYFSNTYSQKLYLNSTAYLDGSTAGSATIAVNNSVGLSLINSVSGSTYNALVNMTAPNIAVNTFATVRFGQAISDSNSVEMNYQYKGAGLYTNNFSFGLHSNPTIIGLDGYGQVTLAKSSRFNVSAGVQNGVSILPTLNQSGTAGYTALLINATESSTGSGTKLLADFQVGGAARASIDSNGNVRAAGLLNTATFNNSRINMLSTGTSIDRNIADANPALIVNQVHASSTGKIFDAQAGGVSKVSIGQNGVLYPVQATTAGAPTYVKGGIYFDTTLNKLRVGGATAWETVTSV